MLTTLLPPTSGTAIVNGFDIRTQADDVRRSIGVIPQAMTSDLELSVEENLSIFAKLYSVPREKRRTLIDELLAAVELTDWADEQVRNLSGGMRRRVEIARGLVHEPRIFFLDEPTTGLDPGLARRRVGDAAEDQAAARPDDSDHDALHGRGRQALRPHRDRRSRRAEGARLADEAEGVDSGQERARGELHRARRTTGPRGSRRCRASRPSPATTASSGSRRTTDRRRRWR